MKSTTTGTVIFMSEISLVDSPLILRRADSERAVSGVKRFSLVLPCFNLQSTKMKCDTTRAKQQKQQQKIINFLRVV